MASRSAVLTTQVIKLRVVFEDGTGTLIDPWGDPEDEDFETPTVWIYDEEFDLDEIEAEVEAEVFTGSGPFSSVRISTGYYEYEYTVPSASDPGSYHDLWITTRDGIVSSEIFQFTVVDSVDLSIQTLQNNQLVVVQLDSSIADMDGNLLGEDITITYSTIFSPLYASPDLVRAEVGVWIDFVPDDTLNLLIHWASKEVDVIGPVALKKYSTYASEDNVYLMETSQSRNTNMFRYARTKFVVYDVAWRVLMLPGAANASNVTGAGHLKRLGDLTIQGPSNAGFGMSGLTMQQMNEIKRKRDEWERVVNAGGNIVPGQSLDPTFAVKGFADPDRRKAGRLWEDPNERYYKQPSQNTKTRCTGNRTRRFFFGD